VKDYSTYYPSINGRVVNDTEILFREKLNTLDGCDVTIDGITHRVIIHNHTNPLDEYKEDRKLLCLNEVNIHRGSYVDFNGETYLVVTDIDKNEVFKSCKIRKCNYILTFLNSSNIPTTIPCIVEDAVKYSSGVNEGNVMSLPDGQLLITLSDNEQTQQIIKQDYRLMLYKKAFKVTYDNRTQDGLVKLTVVQVATQEGDTDEIAYNPVITITPIPTGNLILDGSDSIIINREQSYTVKMDDNSPYSAVYRFDLSDNTLGLITSVADMSCTIKGLSKGNLILTATKLSDGSTITKNIIVKSLL
jgi:hypothetical protein